MGLYDTVTVLGPAFVCSEGHSLEGECFQSKDFGETMGEVDITHDRAKFKAGGWGDGADSDAEPTGEFDIYASCPKCPAFVQPNGNVCLVWVEFRVVLEQGRVVSVSRISESTAEWLEKIPTQSWMKGSSGPMTHEEARVQQDAQIRAQFQARAELPSDRCDCCACSGEKEDARFFSTVSAGDISFWDGKQPVVTLRRGGAEVILAEGVTFDDAALLFWKRVDGTMLSHVQRVERAAAAVALAHGSAIAHGRRHECLDRALELIEAALRTAKAEERGELT